MWVPPLRALSAGLAISRFFRSPHGSTPPLPSLHPHRFPLSSRRPHSRNTAAAGGRHHRFRFPLVPPSSRPSFMRMGLVLLCPPRPHLLRSLCLGFLLFVFFLLLFCFAALLTPCCTIHSCRQIRSLFTRI
jgi:hypothetical protein